MTHKLATDLHHMQGVDENSKSGTFLRRGRENGDEQEAD